MQSANDARMGLGLAYSCIHDSREQTQQAYSDVMLLIILTS